MHTHIKSDMQKPKTEMDQKQEEENKTKQNKK